MNEIVNNFLLAGDKFIERQSGFTCSACGPFPKNKEEIRKFKETGDSRYIFQHDIAYGGFKDLTRRTVSDKILCDKSFNIAKNPKYVGYQRGLASMIYNFLEKKTFSGSSPTLPNKSAAKNENMPKKELAEKLHKPIIRKFGKRKVHSPFIDNIWRADFADM